ncbi:hypothetical protein RIR_e10385_A0A2N0QYX9_9GLOM [Rhizophagus irregularis DAOM 181602=DAOM 197198]|nr:hypothetical protein RIR_e10385_A0A2N0QYX9_9GLOM [Rhizophagus irregularis DAOM 181602=DAOM 197198]
MEVKFKIYCKFCNQKFIFKTIKFKNESLEIFRIKEILNRDFSRKKNKCPQEIIKHENECMYFRYACSFSPLSLHFI